MRARKALLVVNPAAGAVRAYGPEKLARLLGSHGVEVECLVTGQGGNVSLSELARGAEEQGHGMVVAAGGDGTVRTVACATKLPVAILPAGTSNSIARSLGIPLDIREACRVAATGHVREIDLGVAEGPNLRRGARGEPVMYFVLCASAGFDAEAARRYERRRSARSSMLRYAAVAVEAALRFEHRDIYVLSEGRRIAVGKLVIVSNCRHYGGWFRPSPRACPTDGLLDLVAIRSYGMFGLAGAGVYALLGVPQRAGRSGIRAGTQGILSRPSTVAVPAVRLESARKPEVPFELDGEPAGTLPVDLSVKAGVLRMVTGTA